VFEYKKFGIIKKAVLKVSLLVSFVLNSSCSAPTEIGLFEDSYGNLVMRKVTEHSISFTDGTQNLCISYGAVTDEGVLTANCLISGNVFVNGELSKISNPLEKKCNIYRYSDTNLRFRCSNLDQGYCLDDDGDLTSIESSFDWLSLDLNDSSFDGKVIADDQFQAKTITFHKSKSFCSETSE
jgi:hypothetical protein